ncbi:9363_t:CDS:1 [Acaulospora colombiana]|uniref:9363_t:CDS:1 n=1 Tax=Acaulospora colombiana TaxID=27376 RepID=A0ACA9KBI9_9GLOM|nr:9363_t:CDS:1 [Acaulospora colombiana]
MKAVVENNALQTILLNQAPNYEEVIRTIRRNDGSRCRSKYTAYHAFFVVLREEAKVLLNENNPEILRNAATLMWKMVPRLIKEDYVSCARVINANIPTRKFGRK